MASREQKFNFLLRALSDVDENSLKDDEKVLLAEMKDHFEWLRENRQVGAGDDEHLVGVPPHPHSIHWLM